MRCHTPFVLKATSDQDAIPLNCGKCPYCKKRRVSSWVFRLLQEDKVSLSSHFITLTYDTRHIPITPNGYKTLVSRIIRKNKHGKEVYVPHPLSFQAFMKRLRKLQKEKIRYYAVGEYGSSKNNRPHYHAIIFNVQDIETISKAWQAIETHSGEKSQIGTVHIGSVSGNSIAYTAKYIDKLRRIPVHKNDDRLPEFSLMSNGLGKNYLTKKMKHWHKKDLTRMYCTLPDGIKVPMPDYYRNEIFTDDEKEQQRTLLRQIEVQDIEKIRIRFEKYYKNSDITFDQYLWYLKSGEYNRFYKSLNPRQ